VQSKARRNQLNLLHGTETKPDMLKTVSSQRKAGSWFQRRMQQSVQLSRAEVKMDQTEFRTLPVIGAVRQRLHLSHQEW